MAWATPPTYSDGERIGATKMNVLGDDLIYLKGITDWLIVEVGRTSETVTLLPIGAVTTCVTFGGFAWNQTSGAAIDTWEQHTRAPGGASVPFSDGGGNIVTMVFNANGSVTASRTSGSAIWALCLLVLYA